MKIGEKLPSKEGPQSALKNSPGRKVNFNHGAKILVFLSIRQRLLRMGGTKGGLKNQRERGEKKKGKSNYIISR